MRIWFDTEFIDDGKTIDLLSIGMIREDGRALYAEPLEADPSKACDWVKKNVLVHLRGPKISRAKIAKSIVDFAGPDPEFWAYFAAYDWVCLCQLFGRMLDVPAHWPNYVHDFKVLAGPMFKMPNGPHDALADAAQLRSAHLAFEQRMSAWSSRYAEHRR